MAFVALLAVWCTFPFLSHEAAQDALPYLVAGDLVASDPGAVYASVGGDLYALEPGYAQRYCALAPPGTDCASINVAYVSTPLALPMGWLAAALGGTVGVLLFRVVAVGCLVGGMLALWERLADRSPRAPALLAATAACLTPSVAVPVGLGQTSPFVFLTICLGVGHATTARRRAIASAAWVLAGVCKLYPFALGAIALVHRRWRFLAWGLGWTVGLLMATLALGPVSLFGDFLSSTDALSSGNVTNPYNGALDALAAHVWPALGETGPAGRVFLVARVAVLAAIGWWRFRRCSIDAQWAAAALAFVAIAPLVWSHYLWAVFAAVAVVVGERRTVDDRLLALVPISAALLLPVAIATAQNVAVAPLQAAILLAGLIAVAVLVEPAPTASPRREKLLPSAP